MQISVIIPIYGVEKYIEKNLRSLFGQSKTDGVEFILVNDCTKDSSMEIVQHVILEYPNLDIKIIEHGINKGLACARQTGMNIATGTYVIHIDSDDWCEPKMLEELFSCATKLDADIVICNYFVNYPNSQKQIKQQPVENNGIECAKLLLDHKIIGVVWNKLIRRSLFVENNLSWVPKIDLWEDLLITTKLFCFTNRIAYLPKAFLHYVQNGNSMCQNISERQIGMTLAAMKELEIFFKEHKLIEILEDNIKHRKVLMMSGVINSLSSNKAKRYIKLFPDIKGSILETNLQFYYKISTYAAYHNCMFISRTINWGVNLLKKYTRYLF